MFTQITKNWNKLLVVIVSLFLIGSSFFINIDDIGEEIVTDSLKEATVVFGIAKGLNAAISLAQGTEVGPAGITLALGEVLDPINDLVEQFSWIMLASIISLGLQKILMNFVSGEVFNIILVASIVILNIWLFVRFTNDAKARGLFFKITIILIFFRFAIPVMSIANTFFYEAYVKDDYNIEKIKQEIEKSSENIESITYVTVENKNEGFIDRYTKFFSLQHYKDKIEEYKKATKETGAYIIDLIVAFTFKTMFFPLLFLFFLYQFLRNIFNIGR